MDDYSFDPSGGSDAYSDNPPPAYNSKGQTIYDEDPLLQNPFHNKLPNIEEEEVAPLSSVWPESAPPTIFPSRGISPPSIKQSHLAEDFQHLPKQHVFAPPGKVGIALDTVNGQPVVVKIRRNSPLENMLQPNDIITAVDDDSTGCMTAADVTSMMVKRMDRVRKISFVRR